MASMSLKNFTYHMNVRRLPHRKCILMRINTFADRPFDELLNRGWLLPNPETQIHIVSISETNGAESPDDALSFSIDTRPSLFGEKRTSSSAFYVVRDDLLHPFVNGNKARKLDAVIPALLDHCVTDLVTCGGCQSAHTAAVAVSCAEKGISSHLLLRGEPPEILTGYNLVSAMYGNVTYIARSVYAKREEMLLRHAELLAGKGGCVLWLKDIVHSSYDAVELENLPISGHRTGAFEDAGRLRKVAIVNEGAGDALALLGVIRLVKYLSQKHLFGNEQPVEMVVDAGTGTTAVGLGLGVLYFGLPWKITAIMLADDIEGYQRQEKRLVSDFTRLYGLDYVEPAVHGDIVHWVNRIRPRKFGKVLEGEVKKCRHVAQQTGILVDPIYTLSAWELATQLCRREETENARVVMLHTGGTLGMFGVAQRYKHCFHAAMQK
ncbi:hypothetical protein QJS04_geneDACA006453 [Acorus gramineus]|uniref:BPL/LPL catalytic domain-containing protein n=1 Tax=Acorus gramineus TaxID=55184 RepID=A0AAV9AYU2_ACOGR|nr:hypothetical protein QJS04_geneDACA006453 [Acorus gramineus]